MVLTFGDFDVDLVGDSYDFYSNTSTFFSGEDIVTGV